jgi:hypothetical protein
MLRTVIVLTLDDIRLTAETVRDREPRIRYWGRMISVFVTGPWGFRTGKSSTARILGVRKIFSVPPGRDWFGVSRTKGLNRSRVPLPICPHCGAGNGASSPNFYRNFYARTIATDDRSVSMITAL